MYIEAHVHGKPTKPIIETSVTHNFISLEDKKRLELEDRREGEEDGLR